MTDYLIESVENLVEVETQMVSVERCHHYTLIETENQTLSQSQELANFQISKGEIQFENVSMKYRPQTPTILNQISFKIESKQKIGLVGRTGSGKSSICLAIFRIVEIESGSIYIDGQNIQQIGLDNLRQQISYIPQEPILFSGTLKENLDPFQQYSDEEIIKVLQDIQLYQKLIEYRIKAKNDKNEDHLSWETINSDKDDLQDEMLDIQNFTENYQTLEKPLVQETQNEMKSFNHQEDQKKQVLEIPIKEQGSNLSQGERQLLCIGRAILRKNKILIMDEATAAIDLKQDQLIQNLINETFKEVTILTIAHRISTIQNYDKVLVLSEGKIILFDVPEVVLSSQEAQELFAA